MTADERWLESMWAHLKHHLPPPPTRVVELGCGPLGGFVPMLRAAGYEGTGVDPRAPAGPAFHQQEFGHYRGNEPAGAIIACTSLHHVADLGEILDRVEAELVPDGLLVVVEWARERFDEATAQWCFDRLAPDSGEDNWLRERRVAWQESGQPWQACLRSWAEDEGMHAGETILAELNARFDAVSVSYGPYFFADLFSITEAEEQAAINAGQIQANRIDYVGRRRFPVGGRAHI